MSDEQRYAQRAADRENRLTEEKKKVQEKIQQGYSAHREQYEKEIEAAREESRKIAEREREALTALRLKQAQELADLEAQINAATQEKIALKKAEGREEVEKRKEEMEKLQKHLQEQADLRRSQLNDSSEILKNGEKHRQDMLNKCRDDRKKEMDAMNAKTEELNQKLHETKMDAGKRLQQLDAKSYEEEKALLRKKDVIIGNGIINTAAISSSLNLEDAFEPFKQQCRGLRDQHKRFCIEYDTIEPLLLKTHYRIEKGVELKDECDMDELLGALRIFYERASAFSAEGSNDEENFKARRSEAIEIIRQLRSDINNIKAKIEAYEDDIAENTSEGIGEELVNIGNKMKEMGELIQLFNVIGVNHLQETLAIQMDQAQSSRRLAAIDGPPVYDAQKKVKPDAIAET